MEYTFHPEHPKGFCTATSIFLGRIKTRWNFIDIKMSACIRTSGELHQTQPAAPRVPSGSRRDSLLDSFSESGSNSSTTNPEQPQSPSQKTGRQPELQNKAGAQPWLAGHPLMLLVRTQGLLLVVAVLFPKDNRLRGFPGSGQTAPANPPSGTVHLATGSAPPVFGKKSKRTRSGENTNIEPHCNRCSGYRTNLDSPKDGRSHMVQV